MTVLHPGEFSEQLETQAEQMCTFTKAVYKPPASCSGDAWRCTEFFFTDSVMNRLCCSSHLCDSHKVESILGTGKSAVCKMGEREGERGGRALARGQEFRSSGAVESLGIFQELSGSQLAGSRLSQKKGSTGAIVNQSWILNQPKKFGFYSE